MLKISKLSDYAVVIVGTMAVSQEDKYSAAVLAKLTNISEPTVSKLLKLLAKGNIVASIRGAQGGYYLMGDLDSFSVVDVMAAIDGPLALTSCVDSQSGRVCTLKGHSCVARGCWHDVNDAVYDALSKVKLSAMVSPEFKDGSKASCCGGADT